MKIKTMFIGFLVLGLIALVAFIVNSKKLESLSNVTQADVDNTLNPLDKTQAQKYSDPAYNEALKKPMDQGAFQFGSNQVVATGPGTPNAANGTIGAGGVSSDTTGMKLEATKSGISDPMPVGSNPKRSSWFRIIFWYLPSDF